MFKCLILLSSKISNDGTIIRDNSAVILFNFKQIVLDLFLITLCYTNIEVKYTK